MDAAFVEDEVCIMLFAISTILYVQAYVYVCVCAHTGGATICYLLTMYLTYIRRLKVRNRGHNGGSRG